MTLPTKIQAARYSALQFREVPNYNAQNAYDDLGEAGFNTLYNSGVTNLGSIREMSRIGSYRNVQQRQFYGGGTDQVQGAVQSENFLVTVNVATQFAANSTVMTNFKSQDKLLWRLCVLDRQPTNYTNTGIATVPNALVYFFGSVVGWGVSPQLADGVTYELEIAVSGGYYGLYTL